jgi:anaerobic magnesium-protoporphyrin IX monomethyl ester cyclase
MSNLKIVLLNVKVGTGTYWEFYPPLGLLSIATYVISKKIVRRGNLIILDINMPNIVEKIKEFKPDIVGISAFSTDYSKAKSIAHEIKKISKALIIIGGVHISLFPQQLAKVFDLGVLGEGEKTFAELLAICAKNYEEIVLNKRKDLLKSVPGLVLSNLGKKILTPRRTPIEKLDDIPPLDWSLLNDIHFRFELLGDQDKGWKALKTMPIFTSRGCPYNCVFCARKFLWQGIRYFSSDHVVKEIRNLVENHQVTAIHIWDDLFVVSEDRLMRFYKALQKEKLIGKVNFYRVFARTDLIDERMMKILKKIGVKSLAFGFESGSNKVLQYVKRNTTTVETNERAIELCSKYGIGIVACLMVGLQDESIGDMNKTLEFCRDLAKLRNLEILDVSRATPYPGTELWDYALKKHLISPDFDWSGISLTGNNKRKVMPFLIKDKKRRSHFFKIWTKIKGLERGVIKSKQEEMGWREENGKLLNLMNKKRSRIKFELLANDLSEGRILMGLKTLMFYFIQDIKRINIINE